MSCRRSAGGLADGEPWLAKAERALAAAATLIATDASRFAALAVLAHQGLRATTKGGHLAVDEAVRAQFGDAFRPFKALRIRRNELECPDHPDEVVEPTEATGAVADSRGIIDAAAKLLPHLGLF